MKSTLVVLRTLPGQCLWLLMVVSALAGCATGTGEQGTYVYQSDEEYVRLVPAEPGAPANSHPFEISEDQLSRLLGSIKVSGSVSIDAEPVFSFEELETVVPPLVEALAKAGPNQDIVFAAAGHRGMFGRFSPESVTTGRLFVREGALNLIFGLMQTRLDIGELDYSRADPKVVPGSRTRNAGNDVWQIHPGLGRLREQRGDWVVFNRAAIPAPEPARASPSTPARQAQPTPRTPARVEEIEQRLRVLDALRERGVITDEEYLERRQAILEEL